MDVLVKRAPFCRGACIQWKTKGNFQEQKRCACQQVYKGVLRSTGEAVAVKVQRPGIGENIAIDVRMRWCRRVIALEICVLYLCLHMYLYK